jgi:hypothetical protein
MNLKNDVIQQNDNINNISSINNINNEINQKKGEKNFLKNKFDDLLNNLFDSFYKNKLDGILNFNKILTNFTFIFKFK